MSLHYGIRLGVCKRLRTNCLVPVGGMRRPGFVLHFGQDRHSRRDQDVGIGDGFRGKSDDSVPEPALTVDLVTIGGPPELGHLFIDVPADMIAGALEAWEWIGLDGLTTIAVSAFGEPFFRDTQGAIHQLDTLDGKLNAVAGSLSEFTAILQEEAARDELLLAGLVLGAIGRGLPGASGSRQTETTGGMDTRRQAAGRWWKSTASAAAHSGRRTECGVLEYENVRAQHTDR
jgi:hypothetical protein